MSANGKYRVIAVDTLEERKRHRVVVEETLKKIDLPMALREELRAELALCLQQEYAARRAVEDAEQEEERAPKGEQDGDQGDGGAGGTGSAGGSGGGSGGGMGRGELSEMSVAGLETAEPDGLELGLLFFLAEQAIAEPIVASDAVAAATLSFNADAGLADLHEPYVETPQPVGLATAGVLLSLEQHAARLGARALRLQAHADAAAMLQKKCGYQPQGPVVMRSGVPMQKMVKQLAPNALPTNGMTG